MSSDYIHHNKLIPATWHMYATRNIGPQRSNTYRGHHWTIVTQEEHEAGNVVGLDVDTGEACDPTLAGIFDNYLVKKQILQGAPVIASQLLLVDEVMRAGDFLISLRPQPYHARSSRSST